MSNLTKSKTLVAKPQSSLAETHPVAKKLMLCALAKLNKDFEGAFAYLAEAELVLARFTGDMNATREFRMAKKVLIMERMAHKNEMYRQSQNTTRQLSC